MNSRPSVTFWLFKESYSKTLTSGGLKLLGGLWHLASVEETTFAGLFPRGPNTQKVSLELLISVSKLNG